MTKEDCGAFLPQPARQPVGPLERAGVLSTTRLYQRSPGELIAAWGSVGDLAEGQLGAARHRVIWTATQFLCLLDKKGAWIHS